MLIATFGPSTAWVGKKVTYDNGQFTLEDVGQVPAQAVVDYDRQGHLLWAYDGLREWAYGIAGQAAPAPVAPAAPVAAMTAAATAAPEAAAAPPKDSEPPAPAEAPSGTHGVAGGVAPPRSPLPGPAEAQPEVQPEARPMASESVASVAPVTVASVAPEPAAPVAPEPAVSVGPKPAAEAGGSRRGWFILGGVVIMALLVGIVLAGGRLRDGLGVALTLLAIVFVVALVVAAVKPAGFARWFAGLSPRNLLIACAAVAAGCFAFAALLWWVPHYEVVAPADKRIALDDKPEIKLLVVNRGLLGGTYSAAYAVDGRQQDAVTFALGGGDGRELTLSLPPGVERGNVLLSLGGTSIEAQAVAPPAFAVAPLLIDPAPAKVGDDVVLTTSVKNTGDIAGAFGGSLLVDGKELLAKPVEIAPGQTRDVSYDLTADAEGQYQLQLGDAASKFIIVKPVRLANGYVIKRSAQGGRAYMTVSNETGVDAVALLTRSSNRRKPVLAVYVREGKKARIKGIPDGTYVLWDCCGAGFNWTMRDFYTTTEHKRWLEPLRFDTTASTRSWTEHWSDPNYNYSQRHSQTTTHWTNWTVTLGTEESKYTKLVSEGGFPQL